MADNPTINNSGGTPFVAAADEITVSGSPGAGQVQYVKLVDGTNGGTEPVAGDSQGLWTVPRYATIRIPVTSGGLTTAATAYTAGDQVGTLFTFANAARATGLTGKITGASLVSAADTIGTFDLLIFRDTLTLAADNAAFAISDADSLKYLWTLPLLGAIDIGNNRVAQSDPTRRAYDCAGTSLYGALITRTAIAATPFAAATDIQLTLFVELD